MSDPNTFAGDAWLMSVLSGDAPLMATAVGGQVYDRRVPQTAVYPIIQVRYYRDVDSMTENNVLVMNRAYYQVLVIDRSDEQNVLVDIDRLQTIYQELHLLIHGQSGSNALGTVYFCARQRGHRNDYAHDGIEYTEVGGLYCVWIGP